MVSATFDKHSLGNEKSHVALYSAKTDNPQTMADIEAIRTNKETIETADAPVADVVAPVSSKGTGNGPRLETPQP